uniref:TNFR-Cys domain-containing protein n=1 Tax=Myripristis murdjan TaxID=586833 RepID=A0A667WHZ6_9TELE
NTHNNLEYFFGFSFLLLLLYPHNVGCKACDCGGCYLKSFILEYGNRVNKHCTEYTTTSCEPCTDGTFLDQPNGQTECFPCTKYDAGLKVKSPCTTTSDAVCEPRDGFFCVDRRWYGCVAAQKHRSCKPGQYISQRATTDTECSDCTGETYSNGTSTSCQPHTKCESEGLQQIRPGNHSADSECGPKHDSSNKTAIIVPLVLVAVIIVAVAAAVMWRRKKRPKQSNPSVIQLGC